MELCGDTMECPPIQAQVALGSEDLTVKVKPSLILSHVNIVSYTTFSSCSGERSRGRGSHA